MKLTDLNPRWLGAGGHGITDTATGLPVPERHGVAVGFDCPCGCDRPCCIPLRNPLDGGPSVYADERHTWERIGDTFETLVLRQSIQRADPDGCKWHGFVGGPAGDKPGEVVRC
jgi:hypothetical protein